MSSNKSNEIICNKCNTEYNKWNECTPDTCGIFETCEKCGIDINCNKANLHILVNNQNTQAILEDLVYCRECCENRTEEQFVNGWICDECDYNLSDNDSTGDECDYNISDNDSTDDEHPDDEPQDNKPPDG